MAADPLRLTAPAIGLYAITSVIAVLTTAEAGLEARVPIALAVTGVAVVAAFAFAPRVRGLISLVAVATIVGALRGSVLVIALDRLDADAGPELPRIASSTFSAIVWLVAVVLVLAGRDRYRAAYAAAVRQLAEARAAESLDALPEVRRLKRAAGSAAARTSEGPTAEALREAARALRAEIEEGIRPLSHRIWFSARSLEPHTRLSGVVPDAATAFTVPVAPVVAVWGAASLLGAPGMYGARAGIVGAVASTACLWGALLASRALMERPRGRWCGPVLIAACAVVPIVCAHAIGTMLGFPLDSAGALRTYLLGPLALAFLILAAASVRLSIADRGTVLAIARARAVPSSWPRDLSAYLHNSLQSEVTSLAMQFDGARPGSREAQVAVERLAALASRSIADDFRLQRSVPLDRLREAAAAWRAIADVRVVVDPAVDDADPRLPEAVQAAQEMTSNAIRHGRARSVEVRLSAHHGRLVLEVASDATVAPQPGTGLGSAWLARAAFEGPAVALEHGRTVVRVAW